MEGGLEMASGTTNITFLWICPEKSNHGLNKVNPLDLKDIMPQFGCWLHFVLSSILSYLGPSHVLNV